MGANTPPYADIAREARLKVLDLIYRAQTSHIGSNFSCIDILTVLFEKIDLDKDEFVLSKGWVAASLYYFLWRKGRITEEQLDSYCQPDSDFIGLAEPMFRMVQCDCNVKEGTQMDGGTKKRQEPQQDCKKCHGKGKYRDDFIRIAGGSMGLGLPGAIGMALAKKIKGEPGKVYVLMSDGEMQIGTFWESMLIARQHKLDNLVILVDYNGLQAMGKTEDILRLDIEGGDLIDGHDYEAIAEAIESHNAEDVAVFKTVKGKGVSFMEGNNLYHYKGLSDEEYKNATAEVYES